MAEWNDPRTTQSNWGTARINGDVMGQASTDQGLRRYMLSIYNYMASGVLLSGLVALLFATTGMAEAVFGTPLRWLVALAPLGFVIPEAMLALLGDLSWLDCECMHAAADAAKVAVAPGGG